jgi:hypothetical protein
MPLGCGLDFMASPFCPQCNGSQCSHCTKCSRGWRLPAVSPCVLATDQREGAASDPCPPRDGY